MALGAKKIRRTGVSNDSFWQVFGSENSECVCQGLKDIFDYIGGVPPCLYLIMPLESGNGLVTESTKASYLERLELTTILEFAFVTPMPATKMAMSILKSLTIEKISSCLLFHSMTS